MSLVLLPLPFPEKLSPRQAEGTGEGPWGGGVGTRGVLQWDRNGRPAVGAGRRWEGSVTTYGLNSLRQ